MGIYEINKISLSVFNEKRFVSDDGIPRLACLHKDLKNRFTQMIINKRRFKKILTNVYKKRKAHVNRGLIDGVIGIHVRSIVKWGYQDNFKPVYLFIYFFYEKISHTQKAPKHKTNNFHPLRSLCAQNFVLLVNVCLWVFLCVRNLFAKKINRLEIVLITSIHFTTSKKFIKKMFFFSLLFLLGTIVFIKSY